jgi:hypothetical protein
MAEGIFKNPEKIVGKRLKVIVIKPKYEFFK